MRPCWSAMGTATMSAPSARAALGHVGLIFVGVVSLGTESNVRTDWLSFIVVTTTDEEVGAAVLEALSFSHELLICLTAP